MLSAKEEGVTASAQIFTQAPLRSPVYHLSAALPLRVILARFFLFFLLSDVPNDFKYFCVFIFSSFVKLWGFFNLPCCVFGVFSLLHDQ